MACSATCCTARNSAVCVLAGMRLSSASISRHNGGSARASRTMRQARAMSAAPRPVRACISEMKLGPIRLMIALATMVAMISRRSLCAFRSSGESVDITGGK